MANVSQLKCKQCGAPLEPLSATSRTVHCKYCGETMTLDDLERPQAEAPAPAPAAPTPQVIYQVVQPQQPAVET